MIVLGIDPGLGGALALLDCAPQSKPRLLSVLDVPTVGEDAKRRVWVAPLLEWLLERRPTGDLPPLAYVERAQAMPDQGASSGFIYGRAVGYLEATTLAAGYRLKTAEPAVWKRRFGLLRKSPDDNMKAKALAFAKANVLDLGDALDRKGDHNRAEAMLIGAFGAMCEKIDVRVSVSGELALGG